MAQLRNIRHEHFCREFIKTGGNGAEAYRRVADRFPNKPLRNPNAARVIACTIRKRPEVRRREQELRQMIAKKADITLDKLLSDIQEAIAMARAQAKPNDLVNAAMAQAKLVGLLRDRIETGQPGDFDGLENISDILEKVQADVGPEAALALARAFGYAKAEEPSQIEQPETEDAQLAKAIPPSDSVN
jgi:hypothetical protein